MTRIDSALLRDAALGAVLDAIAAGGHRALVVGGAVRNALIGEAPTGAAPTGAAPGDIDIATDARPDRTVQLVEAAGLRAVPTGIEHGTVTVVSQGRGFEVTTFRRDIATDGRRAAVAFSDRLEDDAQRRDFTMNALYAERDGTVIDPVGGLADLAARRLRFVGLPEDRITEDYLRILRFFRFHAWYGRAIDPPALAACAALAQGLSQISRERVGAEMRKLLAAPDPAEAVSLMARTGVLDRVLPDADAGALAALIAAEEGAAASWMRRLAALRPRDAADALRLSRAEARDLAALAEALAGNWSLGEAGYRLGAGTATDYALLRRGRGATLPDGWRDVIARAAGSPLPIAAADLMPGLGGPALGRGLKAAERLWIDGDFAVPAPALIDAALLAGAKVS